VKVRFIGYRDISLLTSLLTPIVGYKISSLLARGERYAFRLVYITAATSIEASSAWHLSPSHTDLWSRSPEDESVYRTVAASAWDQWVLSGKPACYSRKSPPRVWYSMSVTSCHHSWYLSLPVACCCKPLAVLCTIYAHNPRPCHMSQTRRFADTSISVDRFNIQTSKYAKKANQGPI